MGAQPRQDSHAPQIAPPQQRQYVVANNPIAAVADDYAGIPAEYANAANFPEDVQLQMAL